MTTRITSKGHCRHSGKRCFPTHRTAVAALGDCVRKQMAGKVYRMERDLYLCPHCDAWHLTSTRRKAA